MSKPLTREQIEENKRIYVEEYDDLRVAEIADTALHYEARLREVEAELHELDQQRQQEKRLGHGAQGDAGRIAELEARLREGRIGLSTDWPEQ